MCTLNSINSTGANLHFISLASGNLIYAQVPWIITYEEVTYYGKTIKKLTITSIDAAATLHKYIETAYRFRRRVCCVRRRWRH